MKNKGFISINRALKEHWVYQDPHALKLWVTLLFVVNYKEGKLKLGNKLYTIQRGQSSMSLRSLANQSGTSVKKLVSILKLFEATSSLTQVQPLKPQNPEFWLVFSESGLYSSLSDRNPCEKIRDAV